MVKFDSLHGGHTNKRSMRSNDGYTIYCLVNRVTITNEWLNAGKFQLQLLLRKKTPIWNLNLQNGSRHMRISGGNIERCRHYSFPGTVLLSETKKQPVSSRPLHRWFSSYEWQTKTQPATTKQPSWSCTSASDCVQFSFNNYDNSYRYRTYIWCPCGHSN